MTFLANPRALAPLAARAVGVLATLLLLVTPILTMGAIPAVAQTVRPQYSIDLRLDVDEGQADVLQTVAYTNQTGDPLRSIVFHITAAYYGAFTLVSAKVDDQAVIPTLDGIVLEVPLPRTLAPGAATTVTFAFSLTVPSPGNLRFGFSQGILALGNWYPVLAVYRKGAFTYDGRLPAGWDRHQQGTPTQTAAGLQPGDAFFTDMADYVVNLTLNRPAKVAHTGERVAEDGTTLRLRAANVRDFAITASDRYQAATAQVGGTTITVYYLPQHAAGGRQYLESARGSVAWFNQTIGAYPYSSLYVAETASEDSAWVGQEYPQIVFISSQITSGPVGLGSYLSYLVVHEVLHQWYYALVGDDQLYEPWVDEATTVHLSYRYLEAADAGVGAAWWQNLRDQRRRDASIWPDRPVNSSIYDYDDETHYFAMVYRKGASFLEEVRQLLGDETYLKAMRAFTDRYRGGFATGRDLLEVLEAAAGPAIRPIVARYFSYPEYKAQPTAAPTAAVATGTPLATGTGVATPSSTRVLTATVAPTGTATATSSPTPSPTASATATTAPTSTPEPPVTPTEVPAPTPTAIPMPTTPPALTRADDPLATPPEDMLPAAGAVAVVLGGLWIVLWRRRGR
ncbi:MAG: M1 family metallopeptidase [Chloroflexota bacterium]